MSRGRRGVALVGLAAVLGGLAAADVARRESAVADRLGPLIDVVVARRDLSPDRELAPGHLAVRRVPERYAPAGAVAVPAALAGARLAVPVARGAYVTAGMLAADPATAGPGVRAGERALEVLAAGPPELLTGGARVDVLVTRDGGSGSGSTDLALQDVEVLASRDAPDAEGTGAPRVAATLRVSLRQAVYLSAAQAFAREVRLLPRATGDRGRVAALSVGEGLR